MEAIEPGILVAIGGAVGAAAKTLADYLTGAKQERTRERELKADQSSELNVDRAELSKEQRARILFLEKTQNETIARYHDIIEKLRDREDECQARCAELAIKVERQEGEHKVLMVKFALLEKAVAAQTVQLGIDRTEQGLAQLHAAVVLGGTKMDALHAEVKNQTDTKEGTT